MLRTTSSRFLSTAVVHNSGPTDPPDNISVVYNGIDMTLRRSAGASLPPINDLVESDNLPYIVNVGGCQKRKNLQLAIAAASILRRRYGWNGSLVIVNGRHTNSDVRHEVRDAVELGLCLAENSADRTVAHSGVPAWIVILGEVDTLALSTLYREADALIFPSAEEGFGLPPIEAMSSGTPVVAASTSALPEVCGDAAIYGRVDDPGSFADCLSRILFDDALRASMVSAGRRRARLFTAQRMAKDTLAVYEKVLRKTTQ